MSQLFFTYLVSISLYPHTDFLSYSSLFSAWMHLSTLFSCGLFIFLVKSMQTKKEKLIWTNNRPHQHNNSRNCNSHQAKLGDHWLAQSSELVIFSKLNFVVPSTSYMRLPLVAGWARIVLAQTANDDGWLILSPPSASHLGRSGVLRLILSTVVPLTGLSR